VAAVLMTWRDTRAQDAAATTMPTMMPTTAPSTTPSLSGLPTVVIELDGEINDYRERELERRFKEARQSGAKVVILQLRTYGGAVGSALNISRFIKRQTDIHIICLVDEFAYSAGSMIGLACNEVVMEPNAMFGDSGVISSGGEISGETERAKVESPVIEEFRDSARLRGYSELLATALVQVAREVFVVENTTTGEKRFVDRKEHERLLKGGSVFDQTSEWRDLPGVRVPLDDDTTILTVSAEIAQKIGLSKGTFASAQALADARGLQIVQTLRPGAGDQLVAFLSSFAVRSLLSAAVLLSIYMFFQAPGSGFAETLGLVSLTLLLGVPLMTGYASWLEVVLVVLGLILLIVEIFLIPGFGFIGITGIVMVLMGLALTFMPPLVVPGMPGLAGFDPQALRNAVLGLTLALVGSLSIWAVIGRYLPKMPYFNRLVLSGAVGTTPEEGMTTMTIASWPEVGARGEAVSDLRPGGTAMFPRQAQAGGQGQFATADVVCDRGFVNKGATVIVTEVHGNRVVVRTV
jgi:membrane-bound serine protease (ClpP class)